MIYVEVKHDKVMVIHTMPFDEVHGLGKTQEELEQTGFFVDSIPEPEDKKGKDSVLKYNTETSELYYDYIKRKSNINEMYDDLKQETEELNLQYIDLFEQLMEKGVL